MSEVWKDCPSYPGLKASSLGNIKGSRGHILNSYFRKKKGVERYPYRQVSICLGGKAKSVFAHRLVADAFIGPKEDGMEVNHIDGDGSNNRVENLEYCTRLENIRHAAKLGKYSRNGRKKSCSASKSREFLAAIKEGGE